MTQNLGLVKLVHTGVNPPVNTMMIWYDSNTGINIHKYYDVNSSSWLPLHDNTTLYYANFASFPNPGSAGYMYVAQDTGLIYNWESGVYVLIGGDGFWYSDGTNNIRRDGNVSIHMDPFVDLNSNTSVLSADGPIYVQSGDDVENQSIFILGQQLPLFPSNKVSGLLYNTLANTEINNFSCSILAEPSSDTGNRPVLYSMVGKNAGGIGSKSNVIQLISPWQIDDYFGSSYPIWAIFANNGDGGYMSLSLDWNSGLTTNASLMIGDVNPSGPMNLQEGMIRWNGTNYQGYKSGSWVNLDSSGGGSLPSGSDYQILALDGSGNPVFINAIYDQFRNESLDFWSRNLFDGSGNISMSWSNRIGFDPSGNSSIDWNNKNLRDSGNNISVDWNGRFLKDSSNIESLNWDARFFTDQFGNLSEDWNTRRLYDSSYNQVVDWNQKWLSNYSGGVTVDWGDYHLLDSSGNGTLSWQYKTLYSYGYSLDWGNRWLYDTSGNLVVDWNNKLLIDPTGINSVNWYNRDLADNLGNAALNWWYRTLNDSTTLPSIDWEVRLTYDSSFVESSDWQNRKLNDYGGVTTIDYGNCQLYFNDGGHYLMMDWSSACLYDFSATESVNWNSRYLYDSRGVESVAWWSRRLTDYYDTISVSWDNRTLVNASNVNSIDWQNDQLIDYSGNVSAYWGARILSDSYGLPTIDWGNYYLYGPGAQQTIDWANRNTFNSSGNVTIDWGNTQLFDSYGNLSVNWDTRNMFDALGASSIFYNSRVLRDSSSIDALDWKNRLLMSSAGYTIFDWDNGIINNTGGNEVINLFYSYMIDPATHQKYRTYYHTFEDIDGNVYASLGNGILANGSETLISGLHNSTTLNFISSKLYALDAYSAEVLDWSGGMKFSGKWGFSGVSPSATDTGWTTVGTYTPAKTFSDSSTVTLEGLANVVATLLTELTSKGILSV